MKHLISKMKVLAYPFFPSDCHNIDNNTNKPNNIDDDNIRYYCFYVI